MSSVRSALIAYKSGSITNISINQSINLLLKYTVSISLSFSSLYFSLSPCCPPSPTPLEEADNYNRLSVSSEPDKANVPLINHIPVPVQSSCITTCQH